MFAVPGWKVAAKSLVQEQAKPVKDHTKHSKSASQDSITQHAQIKKRKRDHIEEKQGPGVEHHKACALSSNKKKPQLKHPRAENNKDQGQDRYAKKRSRNDQRKDKSSSTGANAEPVAPANARHAAHTSVPPQSQRRESAIKQKYIANDAEEVQSALAPNVVPSSLPPIPPAPTNLTPLQAKMRAKLTSARFRHLNETLYTTSSADALTLFANSPDLFSEYHAGFSQQVKESWPLNPVDVYVRSIKSRGSLSSPVNNTTALPRRRPGTCTIADLGCGDAPLARGLQNVLKKLDVKIHSFDLHAANSQITVADISCLPLRDGEADIAIFCLSLMGTNWLSFVEEAWRVVRGDGKGEVWVAEVKSRFGRISARKAAGKIVENSVGKRRKPQANQKHQPEDIESGRDPAFVEDEKEAEKTEANDDTDLQPFVDSFQRRGFTLKEGSVDKSNKMFVNMTFTKWGIPRAGKWKGMKWNGKEYQRIEDRKPRQQRHYQGAQQPFPTDEEIDDKAEGKLLKPCVYKPR